MNSMRLFQTLNDLLLARAQSKQSITFIEGQEKWRTVSFNQMLQRAYRQLTLFQKNGIKPGAHMLIQCGDNALFIEGFWACLLGGIVAVPVAPGNSAEQRHKLFRIAAMLDNPAFYTDEKNHQRVQQFAMQNALVDEFDQLSSQLCLADAAPFSDSDTSLGSQPVLAHPEPDDIAFIQFSSGSTSTPKGVVLSHRNLLTNVASIIEGCQLTPNDHLLSWMPLTHDMGLIGFHLTPMMSDSSHSLIPTDVFVRRPTLWLTAAQSMRATVLCSPNFGFEHLLKSFKKDKHAELDLSSVRLLFNGAEPISVALCHDFMRTFAAFKLAPDAMFPVYGLAEASLAVSFPDLNKRFTILNVDRSSLSLGSAVKVLVDENVGVQIVSVGKPLVNVELSINDEQGNSCEANVTGRICIRGANVTSGYYNEPELNAALFDDDGWLDTGDLGLIYNDQLYITGRAKDIIFINGQNVYPHDLEELLIQQNLVKRGKVAIASQASTGEGGERLLVFVLHRGELAQLEDQARAITRALGVEAGISVDSVVAVSRIPKTTSGKVQRFQLLKEYESGDLPGILPASHFAPDVEDLSHLDESTSGNSDSAHINNAESAEGESATSEQTIGEQSTSDRLLGICNLHVENLTVGLDDNLFDLGISSLTLAQIHASIEDAWPEQVDITDLFDYPTVAELATFLNEKV